MVGGPHRDGYRGHQLRGEGQIEPASDELVCGLSAEGYDDKLASFFSPSIEASAWESGMLSDGRRKHLSDLSLILGTLSADVDGGEQDRFPSTDFTLRVCGHYLVHGTSYTGSPR